jgi:hypothetical protein
MLSNEAPPLLSKRIILKRYPARAMKIVKNDSFRMVNLSKIIELATKMYTGIADLDNDIKVIKETINQSNQLNLPVRTNFK